MNKKLLVTLTVLAATGCMALAGCNKGSGNTGESTVVDNVTIARVKTTSLKKPIILGEDLDLSNNVEILYSDGTKSNTNFTVVVQDGFVVKGTVVIFYLGGSYDLQIKAERGGSSKVVAFHVDVVTEERLAFETVYKQLDRNYVCYFANDAEGKSIGGITVHKDDDYFYSYFGDEDDEIIAKLTDNNYYRGTVNPKTNGEVNFEFKELCNWSNEWVSSGIQDFFTVDKFVSKFDEEDNETIKYDGASKSLTYFFAVNTNGSYWYGRTKETIEVVAADPEEMTLTLKVYFDGKANDGMYLIFEDIGSVNDEDAEAAVKDPSKIPSKVDGSACEAVLTSANTAKNYTITSKSMVTNAQGQPVENPYAGTQTLGALFENSSVEKKVFATETQTTDKLENAVYGLVEHEGTLYNFQKDGENYPATPVSAEAEQTVWGYDGGSNVLAGSLAAIAKTPLVYMAEVDVDGKTGYKLDTSMTWSFLDLLLWSTGNQVLMGIVYNIDAIFSEKGEDYSSLLGSSYVAIPEENKITYTATSYITEGVYWTYEVVIDGIGTTVRDAIDYSFGA